MKLDTIFDIGDKVTIDNDKSIVAVITGLTIRGAIPQAPLVQYEASWFHNGNAQQAWIEEWRIEQWDA